MNRPWMKFHTRDWLDNKELRRCSPTARAILVDLMCLAHEGTHYGYLDDKMGPLDHAFIAARCFVPIEILHAALDELKAAERVHENNNSLFIKRMVEDEEIRVRRAEGGKLSIGHPHTHPPRVPSKGTLDLKVAHTCADSDSESVSPSSISSSTPMNVVIFPKSWEQDSEFARFAADYMATGGSFIAEDFAEAWQFCWKGLDFEQKLERIQALNKHAEDYHAEPRFIPKPKKFLDTEWKRDPKPPKAAPSRATSALERVQAQARERQRQEVAK